MPTSRNYEITEGAEMHNNHHYIVYLYILYTQYNNTQPIKNNAYGPDDSWIVAL